MSEPKLDKYLKLKKKIEQIQQEANKVEGALEQITEQLRKEFDCATLESAKKKLKVIERQEQKAKIEFENAVEEFEEKWGDRL